MIASDFIPPPRPTFPPWTRYASYVPLYGLGVPIVKLMEAAGQWPRVSARRARKSIGDFGKYQPTGNDVFACSYFKCGTTWLLQIAVQIAHRGHAEFDNVHYVVPWPDAAGPFRKYIIPLSDPSPRRRSPTGLRVIKTHYDLNSIPYVRDAHYIAVTRDPKDVCVSGYHFLRSLLYGPLMPSMPHWVDFFLSPDFITPGSWAQHLSSYWQIRDRPNVLFLTFEEMKQDLAATVRRVAGFLGTELKNDEFDAIVRQSTFRSMKEAKLKFDPGQVVPWGTEEGYLLRRGESGRSGDFLTPAQQQRIDDHCRAELKRLGCDFLYDETFGVRS
jgi:hypothetical protein